jgi:hypothetical protein
MRPESFVRATAHHPQPLVLRGSLSRTFGSLIGFLAALFLLLGLYLLRDAFEHPLAAESVGVLAASISITIAAVLFYYLLRPRRAQLPRTERFRHEG